MAKKKNTAKKLEHRTKSRQETIMEAVLWMDWAMVRKVMKFLNWTWFDEEKNKHKVPSIEKLQLMAIKHANDAYDLAEERIKYGAANGYTFESVSSGGICALVRMEDNEIVEVQISFELDGTTADAIETKTYEEAL